VVTVALLNGVVARCGREWWPSRCDAMQRGGGLASVTGGRRPIGNSPIVAGVGGRRGSTTQPA
jgi:hypothetical protein